MIVGTALGSEGLKGAVIHACRIPKCNV